MLYALIFPVLWSASTGYWNPSITEIQTYVDYGYSSEYQYESVSEFLECIEIIDGSRIGLTDHYVMRGAPILIWESHDAVYFASNSTNGPWDNLWNVTNCAVHSPPG